MTKSITLTYGTNKILDLVQADIRQQNICGPEGEEMKDVHVELKDDESWEDTEASVAITVWF